MASTLRHTGRQIFAKHRLTRLSVARHNSSNVEQNILGTVYKNYTPMKCTVTDFVWQNLDSWPDKTATVCAVTGHGYTYEQTYKMSVTFAASLRTKLKLQNDDVVAIILPNIPEYPCTAYGVLQAGCIATMMSPAYTAYELKRQLELTDVKAIVATKLSYANIVQALNELQLKVPIILVDNENLPEGTIKFAEFAEDFTIDTDCLKSVQRSPKDIAILPFSSGTTGFPKGVVLTHESMVALNQMIADPEIVAIQETTATQQSVLPAVLPFYHIFGFNILMVNQMYFGCKLVTMPYFKPDLFLHTIQNHKVDVMFLVPPMVMFLGKHPAVTAEHVQSLRGIVCGAAPISRQDAEAVVHKNKNIVFRQGYGLTETNGSFSVGKNTDSNYASVGHTFPNCQVKIADLTTNEALGPGQEGEIWFRGPSLMSGYYKNEKATKEVMTDDGWYKTGDIGKYDDDKYLYITDRLKELIKVKGFQVPPAELEAIIRTHPKVQSCAVLGIPDPITGEAPKAFLVPQPGQTIDVQEIKDYVNSKVSSFKRLKEVQIVDSIPISPAGKISKRQLKEKYC